MPYEYQVTVFDREEFQSAEERLNVLGWDGWRVVGTFMEPETAFAHASVVYTLERKRP